MRRAPELDADAYHVRDALGAVPPRPSPLLDSDQREFAEQVVAFALERLDDGQLADRDETSTFSNDGWRRCAELGLCGLPAPEAFGGSGADRVTTAAALEALGYGCRDAGLVFSISAHLWSAVIPLWQHGSPEQQDRYLRDLCSGTLIGLHAMTEPDSGSDAFALRTVAETCDAGFELHGRKSFITNTTHADLFIVFARSPGSSGPAGISGFLVEASNPGLVVEAPTDKMGLRTSPMSELVLDGAVVGEDAVLGRPGRGALVFGSSMEWERLLIMAGALGAHLRAIEDTIEFARSRKQFGQPISRFQAVADRLVDAIVDLDAARALLYESALRFDIGDGSPAVAAGVKLFASESILRHALDLLQVHGGAGYTRPSSVERHVRDAIGGRIYSGTSDMMRRVVARSLGLS